MLIRNEFFRSMSLYKYLAFAVTAVGLLAETPPPAEQPSVTFRSDVSLVRVDAQVVDDQNRPIRGLGPADFALRVNGNPQEARQVITEKVPIDLLILLDVSRSTQPHVERVASALIRH